MIFGCAGDIDGPLDSERNPNVASARRRGAPIGRDRTEGRWGCRQWRPPFRLRIDMTKFFLNILCCLFVVLGPYVIPGCAGLDKDLLISGETMGTTYHITVVAGAFDNGGELARQIEARLEEINQSMSTYRPESEISRFNSLKEAGRPFCPSGDFVAVMKRAEALYRLTEGAWDGTVYPLVRLWGFGSLRREPAVPSDEAIEKVRPLVGFDKIRLTPDGCLVKRSPGVTVDLASMAKGYGVDALAALIRENGYDRFLVEVGGEVYTSGLRRDGKPWRVGINTPEKEAAFTSVYKALPLQDRALATSGNYRNFFMADGRLYSHLLDPRTGRPVPNDVVSASVMAPDCTLADGLATALVVLGWQKGLALVEGMKGVECFLIVREKDGTLTDRPSAGFPGFDLTSGKAQ